MILSLLAKATPRHVLGLQLRSSDLYGLARAVNSVNLILELLAGLQTASESRTNQGSNTRARYRNIPVLECFRLPIHATYYQRAIHPECISMLHYHWRKKMKQRRRKESIIYQRLFELLFASMVHGQGLWSSAVRGITLRT